MAKPVILTVDDEPLVLNAIERDLRRHYGRDYRIIKANSGEQALDDFGAGTAAQDGWQGFDVAVGAAGGGH